MKVIALQMVYLIPLLWKMFAVQLRLFFVYCRLRVCITNYKKRVQPSHNRNLMLLYLAERLQDLELTKIPTFY